MAAIRLLPETTANRIAAGEVVERPAAVVKELVENALDAGARHISVALEDGGVSRILVEDDGHGMGPEDLALAVLRHATSKLPDEATLSAIATLGFRGEALPSIGAVARLTLTSRPAGQDAFAIRVEGGRVGPVVPAAGPPGTRVEVSDLFFATPARRKFLRSPRSEAEHGVEAVRRLALAWPEVAFRCEVEGRCVLDLPPDTAEGRIRAVLGPDFAAQALPVAQQRGAIAIEGLIGAPSFHRASAAEQHLIVNRRPVRDPLLRMALRAAYRDVMPAGRHPVAAIQLFLPAEAVDVNVHPMKTELRFRAPEEVRGALIGALRQALGGGAAAPTTLGWRAAGPWRSPPPPRPSPGFAEAGLALAGCAPAALSPSLAFGPAGGAEPAAERGEPDPPPPAEGPLGRPIGQWFDCYILAEAPDGALILVDQHAAHERLVHERLAQQLMAGGVRAQPLLIPAVVPLPAAQRARVLAAAEDLARLGLEVEEFGEAVLVRALPALLGPADPAALLADVAEEIAAWGEEQSLSQRLHAALARLACHGSIRAGRRLSLPEMAQLLRDMEATPRAATCSHGRPTFLRLDRAALARMFGRS
ncbi:MAG: DNA mismatch repair endonuclease MutL [Rhodovarius sp.]|nr:DNA mismatch repair endonuclease MutL [Rhodovarius sp.]MCX7931354.1 DNA mismatch repair endonuclease MutL [Rhodovarius sp.]MDW8315739.1 DNA mismatch repair endonuclease MutL [Rhodovarius sp.]